MSQTIPGEPLSLESQLCFPLYAASNLLTRLYRPMLAPLGLTYSQYLVMLVLWRHAPVSIGALGKRLYLESGTLSPLLKRMEQGGFLLRTRDAGDERRVLIDLTPHGRALKSAALDIPETLLCQLGLDPSAAGELRDTLQNLLGALARGARLSDSFTTKEST